MKENLHKLNLDLPLPNDLSWALKGVEKHAQGIIDEFYPQARCEYLTELQFKILDAGIERNLNPLSLTEKIWDNIKSFSTFAAGGNIISCSGSVFNYNIFCDYRQSLALKAIKLITKCQNLDLLYQGIGFILDELDKDGDYEMYVSLCEKMEEMLMKDPNLNIENLSLKDLSYYYSQKKPNNKILPRKKKDK